MAVRRSIVALCLAGLAWGAAAAEEESQPALALLAAETALELNRHILAELGIEPVFDQTVGAAGEFTRVVYPALAPPSLKIRATGGSFEGLDGGFLAHAGGFEMVWPGGRQSLRGFRLAPASAAMPAPAMFELRAADGEVPFYLNRPHPHLLEGGRDFTFLNMDLLISESLARRLGAPELAGSSVGSADLRTRLAEPPRRGSVACESNVHLGLAVDVELTLINGLVEVVCDGERVAMAPSVELRNLGPSDVEWYRPIYPDGGGIPEVVGPHPFLAMSFYRLADGALRQIGRADVKHAFYAANTDCECAGGQILFAGCSDLYQAVTNYNRINLAPRSEVTASTGTWQPLGSHFDGDPVDGERSHHGEGSSHSDPFEHRLTVAVEDLTTPDARYFIEAWYVTAGDVDIFNSMGWREVEPQLSEVGVWTFPFSDAGLTQGATLDAWIDPVSPPPGTVATVLDTGEGHLEVAAAASELPSGAYRYDIALMNFDFDRRIRSLSVPLPVGVRLASVAFHDGDVDPANDWQVTVTASEIVWSTPVGDPALGALDWGTLYGFRFDANAAPAGPSDPSTTMQVLEAGLPSQLTAAAKGPGDTLIAVHRLQLSSAGSGQGMVTSTPAGIDCGADCDELYAPGTVVGLAATAMPGSKLIRWTESGSVLGTAPNQSTLLDGDRHLTAVFELCDRQLEAQVVAGNVTFEACEVMRAGAGFVIGTTGSATLRAGRAVVLDEGFVLQAGGEMVLELDPVLLP